MPINFALNTWRPENTNSWRINQNVTHYRRGKSATLLLGSYGRGNLGDDVFLAAAAELFKHHDLYINSADDTLLPEHAQKAVETISTEGFADVIKKAKVFLKIKNIVYFGGDVWVELYGNRFPRQSLYKMVLLNSLARLFGKKIHYIGTGIGQLRGWSLMLARASARLSHTIVAREKRSADVLGLAGVEVLPDLAVNLPYYRPKLHKLPAAGHPFVIGISLLYHLPDPGVNFPLLAGQIAAFIDALPSDRFRVVLLPMLVSDHDDYDDQWASEQVQQLVSSTVPVEIYQAHNLQDLIQTLGDFHLVVGTRLHTNILATLNATPCLGIAYRAKVSSFFADNSLGKYCVDLAEVGHLPEIFWQMYHNYPVVAEQFRGVSKRNLAQKEAYRAFVAEYE